jgi:hypothetical protein
MAYKRLLLGKRCPRRPLLSALTFIVFLGSLLAVERPCRADNREIEWTVTRSPDAASCPDASALTEAVTKARGPEASRQHPPTAMHLEVAFARGDAGYTATVRAHGPKSGARTLSGPTCSALTDAVIATITVLLDEDPEEPGPTPAPEPAPVATGSAAESPPADAPDGDLYSPLRIGLAAHAGIANFHRSSSSPSNETGAALGGELRIHPHSRHGGAFAITYGGGVFGPNVTLVDAVYSYALMEPRPFSGVSTAAYLDVGPALGLVTKAPPGPNHTVLGGRASITADLQLANFTLGISVGYHGGVPLGGPKDGWEGAFTALLRAGVALDFGSGKAE